MSRSASMLQVCSSCARHVRASDAVCPFCGTKAHRATRVFTAARLSRSALLALAATACGGPNCPPASSEGPTRVLVAELDDGGMPIEYATPAYGATPAPPAPCH